MRLPRVRQSGEKCYKGRISREGNSYVRWYLVQAAWVAGVGPSDAKALLIAVRH